MNDKQGKNRLYESYVESYTRQIAIVNGRIPMLSCECQLVIRSTFRNHLILWVI